MSNSDDKELNEYLGGQSPISSRYRELPSDDVPPELDAAVLSEANAAVTNIATHRKLSRVRRWSVPVTLAATFVLVVSLVIKNNVPQIEIPKTEQTVVTMDLATESSVAQEIAIPVQPAESHVPKPETPPAYAPATAPTPSITVAQKPAVAATQPPQEVIVSGSFVRGVAEDAALPVEVITSENLEPSPSPGSRGPRADSAQLARNNIERAKARESEISEELLEAVVVTAQKRQGAGSAGPRATANVQSNIGDEMEARLEREANPEKWLQHIRDLRSADKQRVADREWQGFRKRYPRFEIAEDDPARPGQKR